jgi:hypothetical protein
MTSCSLYLHFNIPSVPPSILTHILLQMLQCQGIQQRVSRNNLYAKEVMVSLSFD